MKWKKFAAFLCVLGLVLALPAPERPVPADAPAEIEIGEPPLVALTFDDGPRSSTTAPLPDKPGYEDLRQELLAKL